MSLRAGLRGTVIDENGRHLGDIITAIDGRPVRTTSDLYAVLDEHAAGDTVRVTVLRGGRESQHNVTLAEMP